MDFVIAAFILTYLYLLYRFFRYRKRERRFDAALRIALEERDAALRQSGSRPQAQSESSEIIDRAYRYSDAVRKEADRALSHLARAAGDVRSPSEWNAYIRSLENREQGYTESVKITADLIEDLVAEYGSVGNMREQYRSLNADLKKSFLKGQAVVSRCPPEMRNALHDAVLDLFHQRVGAVLNHIGKGENYGVLEHKLHDEFARTNEDIRPLFGAKIETGYLLLWVRLLKLGAALAEIKRQQKEEAQLRREEERELREAAREAKRREREAEEEERRRREALEQAEREHADAETIAQLRAQLANAQQSLEKSRRAVSNAQITRAGTVYIISNIGSFGEGILKIGQTRRDNPQHRIDDLSDASVPFKFDVHAFIRTDDAPGLELKLHNIFNDFRVNKVNRRKEFFRVSLQTVQHELKKHGIDTELVTECAASEWRETQRIESLPEKERKREMERLKSAAYADVNFDWDDAED